VWLFRTRKIALVACRFLPVETKRGWVMRKLFLLVVASLAVLSLGACAGKSPKAPPPVITKG
jgi:hypothetical protein